MSQEHENGNEVAEVISNALLSFSETSADGDEANVVDGLFALSRAVQSGFKWLGNGDAGTTMGAIEAHGKFVSEAIEEGLSQVASSIGEHGQQMNGVTEELGSIANALDRVADALGMIAKAISHEG